MRESILISGGGDRVIGEILISPRIREIFRLRRSLTVYPTFGPDGALCESSVVFTPRFPGHTNSPSHGADLEAYRKIVVNAAGLGCLRGRQIHCAERESDSGNWCIACQARWLLMGEQ